MTDSTDDVAGLYEDEDDYGEGMTMCPQCADRQAELERANERIQDLEERLGQANTYLGEYEVQLEDRNDDLRRAKDDREELYNLLLSAFKGVEDSCEDARRYL
jgi:predicted  nucleic acid-binding Zn-ribbon protein